MPTDIEIARAARKRPIADIAARLGLGDDAILRYGPTLRRGARFEPGHGTVSA
ncbi:hypothetical protein [Paracoccus actinidiae]|uniref:hypothetical protein n=1 Tax=Paracoccus actinidiae TaxID=3064531 RepID=UPI0027D2202F|nr:hypothetical protein [Paracoccus sp. M09]